VRLESTGAPVEPAAPVPAIKPISFVGPLLIGAAVIVAWRLTHNKKPATRRRYA